MAKIDEIKMLRLGQRDENLARSLTFDCSDWLEQYPEASIHILFRRPGESAIVPMSTTLEGTTLTWLIHDFEVGKTGVGNAEFRAVDTAGLRRKSRIIPCSIEETLLGDDETVLYTQDQVDETLAHISEAAQAAQAAKASEEAAALSAQEAGESATSASAAANVATSARDAAQAAQTAAETAQHQAEAAQSGVHADAVAAEQAKVAAQAAQASAQGAASQASADRAAAETARADAEAAATHAEAVVEGIDQAGADQVAAVNAAGQAQVTAVNQAGATQVGNVNAAGTTQVNAVQAKGTQVINSIPADYSALTDDVTELKSALSGIETYVASKNLYNDDDAIIGYLNSGTGVVDTSSTGYKTSDFIPVISGKYITFSNFNYAHTQQTLSVNSFCFYKSDKTTVVSGGTWKKNVLVPENAAYARVCFGNNISVMQIELTDDGTFTAYEAYFAPYYIVNENVNIPISQITGLEDRLDNLDENAEEIEALQTAMSEISESVTYDRFDVYLGPYYQNGVAPDGSAVVVSSWDHTDKIPVTPGDLLKGTTTDNTSDIAITRICAYYNDTILPEKGWSGDKPTFTIPDGVNYVVVTQKRAGTGKTRSIEITGTNSKTKQVIPKSTIGYMRDSGDMSDGDILYVSENNVKNQVVVSFSGNITTFDKLLVGQRNSGNTAMNSCYVEIDDTNVVLHTDQGNSTIPHGLTIANDIQVMICTGNEAKTTLIRVASSGSVFNDTNEHRWLCDQGFACAVSDGSVLTDCALSWTSRNIAKDIWIFGDSYVSLYDVRWVYWMVQDGFDKNCIINGFAGETSERAMVALENLLSVGCPHYIVWCLGMNNGDSSSAVNASWNKNYRKMISLCKQNGITPILATIPNVPTVNNNFKNAVIRNSGYRYIEFSKALDPDEDGDWISGALSGDGIHPSEIGAKISWQRVLVDFPEIATL